MTLGDLPIVKWTPHPTPPQDSLPFLTFSKVLKLFFRVTWGWGGKLSSHSAILLMFKCLTKLQGATPIAKGMPYLGINTADSQLEKQPGVGLHHQHLQGSGQWSVCLWVWGSDCGPSAAEWAAAQGAY